MASSVFSDRVLMRSRSRFDHAARFKYRVPPSRAERDQSENQKMAPVNTHQNQTSDATLKGWLYMCQTRSKTESKDTNVDGKHRKKTQRKSRSLGARDDTKLVVRRSIPGAVLEDGVDFGRDDAEIHVNRAHDFSYVFDLCEEP